MAHLFQVGVGSGGMAVLDLLSRDERFSVFTLVEPDVFQPHNLHRHPFGRDAIGRPKAEVAAEWLMARRHGVTVRVLKVDLTDPAHEREIDETVQQADLGVCAADNEPAKFRFDALMRRAGKPWTLGEVLSGGIAGWVHRFTPGEACYGCVASHLQRSIPQSQGPAPDYSAPGGPVETRVPANIAAIHAVASLHALVTLAILEGEASGFTSLLWTLKKVPGVFDEAYRPYRFRIPRQPNCLICNVSSTSEDLDVALAQALARLGNE